MFGIPIAHKELRSEGDALKAQEQILDPVSAERRSDKRLKVNLPVEVRGIHSAEDEKMEHTFIEDVSDFGCRFSIHGDIQQGDKVILQPLGTNGKALPSEEPRLVEIVWTSHKSTGWTVGAKIVQGEKLGSINFPPEHTTPPPPSK